MVLKGIREGICHAILRYAKVNDKYMKDYNENKEWYLKYWNVDDLYGWGMSQKLPVNHFQWIEDTSQFNEDFIKSCNEESDDGNFPKKLHQIHNDLPFLLERMKTEEVEKLVTNLHDKTEYVIHIRSLKQSRINFEKSS